MSLLGTVAVALLLGGGGGETIILSETSVATGETITVSGGGCEPDTDVNLFLDGEITGRTRTDTSGAFLAPVTIADDVSSGEHMLTTIGSACGTSAALTVRSPAGDDSDTTKVVAAVAIQLVAVLLAITIIVASRRRWREEPPGPGATSGTEDLEIPQP